MLQISVSQFASACVNLAKNCAVYVSPTANFPSRSTTIVDQPTDQFTPLGYNGESVAVDDVKTSVHDKNSTMVIHAGSVSVIVTSHASCGPSFLPVN